MSRFYHVLFLLQMVAGLVAVTWLAGHEPLLLPWYLLEMLRLWRERQR